MVFCSQSILIGWVGNLMYIRAYHTDMAIKSNQISTRSLYWLIDIAQYKLIKTDLHATGLVNLACKAMVYVLDWVLLSCIKDIPSGAAVK
jgi:hypothetical protein